MNKHTLNKAYWRGFIKAADNIIPKAPNRKIASFLPKLVHNAKNVTGFLNNPLHTIFPKSPAVKLVGSAKNVGEQLLSTKPFGLLSGVGSLTGVAVPPFVSNIGTIGTVINTADQLLEYAENGIPATLAKMKADLLTKHFKNPIIDTANDVLTAAGRPLISAPLGAVEAYNAIAPSLKYHPHPNWRPAAPARGAELLMRR